MQSAHQFLQGYLAWNQILANLIIQSYHNRNIFRLGFFPNIINIAEERPNDLNNALRNVAQIPTFIDNIFNTNQNRIINSINNIIENIENLIQMQDGKNY